VPRLTRAQAQGHNRARILAAARAEFAERGFRDAKVDVIAERAELTRGAVYSNFPGKRALYFAVLAEVAAEAPDPAGSADTGARATSAGPDRPPEPEPAVTDSPSAAGRARDLDTVGAGLAAFARYAVARLPMSTDETRALDGDLLPEVQADPRAAQAYAQLTALRSLLLGLALERMAGTGVRMVRVAQLAFTMLHGAGQLAAAAPGFGEPFDVVTACASLAGLNLGDEWSAPHLAYVPRARATDAPWSPPAADDAVRAGPARWGDGVVAVLGLYRLSAIEEAVRAAPPGTAVTAVVVCSDPAEFGALVRLVLTELRSGLSAAVPARAWPALQVVNDETGALAAAAGVPAFSDATEAAIRIAGGRIVARADGYGACHAATTA